MRNVPVKEPLILEAGQWAVGRREAAHLNYPPIYIKRIKR
jgi:hypothetical protein